MLLAKVTISDQAGRLANQLPQAQDSTGTDSTTAIGQFGRGVGEVADLILQGHWAEAGNLLWTGARRGAIEFVPDLLVAVVVGLLFYLIYRAVFRITERVLKGSHRISSGFRDLILNVLRITGLALLVILVLAQLGLDVTAALAGLGILGLALGFAAKDSLENFIAGVTILMDRPFQVGDMIEVEESYGTVTRFTLRSTRIRTLRNRIIVFPNVAVINQKLINHSALRYIRVDVPFGIAYKEQIDQAREVVLGTVGEDDRLAADQPAEVKVVSLGASSVDMELRLRVTAARDEQAVRMDYLEKIRVALREADIEIPFPHLQLFVDGASGLEGLLARRGTGPDLEADGES